jgi:hypothetical protein
LSHVSPVSFQPLHCLDSRRVHGAESSAHRASSCTDKPPHRCAHHRSPRHGGGISFRAGRSPSCHDAPRLPTLEPVSPGSLPFQASDLACALLAVHRSFSWASRLTELVPLPHVPSAHE